MINLCKSRESSGMLINAIFGNSIFGNLPDCNMYIPFRSIHYFVLILMITILFMDGENQTPPLSLQLTIWQHQFPK